jgi:hypothetical protein
MAATQKNKIKKQDQINKHQSSKDQSSKEQSSKEQSSNDRRGANSIGRFNLISY